MVYGVGLRSTKQQEAIIDRMPLDCQSVVAMTELLKSAIAQLKTLPVKEQDAIASIILEEI